jgi:hypothetical protein
MKLLLLLPLMLVMLGCKTTIDHKEINIGKQEAALLTAENCTIVLAPGTSPTAKFAASELQTFLSQILGGEIPVSATPGSGSNLFVGFSEHTTRIGLDPTALVRDGFFLRSSRQDCYLAGIDDPKMDPVIAMKRGGVWINLYERGTLFAAYDFLERFAGVRFYFPGELGTIVPQKSSLRIPVHSIIEKPDFTQRRYSNYYDGEYFEGENRKNILNPMKTLNEYRLRGNTSYLPCCHGLNGFNFLERFGKSHPEYFALLDNGQRHNNPAMPHPGQLCLTSGITEEIYQDIKAYLQGRPASERGAVAFGKSAWAFTTFRKPYVDVMPQDSFYPCKCDKCQAAFTSETYYASKLVWGNVIDWAERLKQDGVEGQLNMMAYHPYRGIPQRAIPDNVNVMVAETGPWSQANPEQLARENAEIKAWVKKLGRKVWLWNYANKFSNRAMPGIPAPTPRAIGKYYQSLAPYIFGMYMESECDRFLYFYLNYYIQCKVAWDNNVDYMALLDEHYRLMFGPAAEPMRKIMERFEDIWLYQISGRIVETALGPISAVPSDHDIWHKVYSPAVLAEIVADFDQAASLTTADSLEARRVALFRREYLAPLQQAAQNYLDKTAAVRGLRFRIPDGSIRLRPFKPEPARPDLVDTTVRAELNADNLVINFDCQEPQFADTVAMKRTHDDPDIWRDNSVEIFLNPSGDRKRYYQLIINSAGSLSDIRYEKIGRASQHDYSWNSDAAVSVNKTDSGFQVRVSIPRRTLPELQADGFPANFCRSRILGSSTTHHSLYIWSQFASGFHDLENFGTMGPGGKEILLDGGFDKVPFMKSSGRHWGFMENGVFRGWVTNPQVPEVFHCELDEQVYFSLPRSMRITSHTAAGASIGQYLTGLLKPDTKYLISAQVKLENVEKLKPSASGFCINLWDTANRWFPQHNWLDGTMDWTYLSFVHTTPPAIPPDGRSYLQMRLMNCSGTAWIDNVSIEELP